MPVLLSILLPTFNHPYGLQRNLENFKFLPKNIEIIVSDDSEGDAVKKVIKAMEADFPNIRYMKGAGGAVKNWNKLLKNCGGRYIWIVHHDEALQNLTDIDIIFKTLEHCEPDLTIMSTILSFKSGILRKHMPAFCVNWWLKKNIEYILKRNYIGPMSSIIVKRTMIENFDENLRYLVDQEWYYRLMRNSSNTVFLKNINILSYQNEHVSITHTLRDEISKLEAEEWCYIKDKHSVDDKFLAHFVIWYVLRAVVRFLIIFNTKAR